jgi:hypothetical protein
MTRTSSRGTSYPPQVFLPDYALLLCTVLLATTGSISNACRGWRHPAYVRTIKVHLKLYLSEQGLHLIKLLPIFKLLFLYVGLGIV